MNLVYLLVGYAIVAKEIEINMEGFNGSINHWTNDR